jgi:hypothetical protein
MQLAAKLRRETTGEALFSRADGRYATDKDRTRRRLRRERSRMCDNRNRNRAREWRTRFVARRWREPVRSDGQASTGARLFEIPPQPSGD